MIDVSLPKSSIIPARSSRLAPQQPPTQLNGTRAMFTQLLSSRRFAPIFWCQFFAALNDNFVKNALAFLILYKAGEQGGVLVTLAGVTLIAPFFILSALGGQIADRFDKAYIAERLKLFEIPVAAIAALGFYLQSLELLFLALAGLGILGALFGPIKYGILPVHLKTEELSHGNALVEGATFLAILAGTIAGGLILTTDAVPTVDTGFVPMIAAAVMALATLSWLAAKMILPTGSADAAMKLDMNPVTSTLQLLADLKSDPQVFQGAVVSAWFWLVGAVTLSLLQPLVIGAIGGAPSVYTATLLAFTVSIAIGSLLAAMASKSRPNLAVVPIGALLMGVAALDLAWTASHLVKASPPLALSAFLASPRGFHILADLALLAIGGGLFVVPSFAAVQSWSPQDRRARIVAGCNVLSAAFMTVASLALAGLQYAGVGLPVFLTILGVANLIVAYAVWRIWARTILKDFANLVFRTFLRLEVKGEENLPPAGTKAIIAPNHISLLDAGILHATMPGHTTYAIDTGMSQRSWIKPFLRYVNWHSIDPTRPLGMRELINGVKGGEQLVIFPEGRLTTTGSLMKVYDGTALIADKAGAIVVPVRIEGPQRAKNWSYLRPSQIKKVWFPKTTLTILPPVKLAIEPALRGKARRQAAGAAMQDMMVDAAVATAPFNSTLFEAVVAAKAKFDTGKPIVEDPLGTKLSYKKLIVGAQVLGAKIAPLTQPGEAVGVLLPNSAGFAVVFFGLQTTGRVAAMLNFSAGAANVLSACKAAQVKTVLTSRAFIEKGRLGDLTKALEAEVAVVYLDDVRPTITTKDKIAGLIAGGKPQVVRSPDDPAAILFTSGSEGTPKGVVLSHRNILSNVHQVLTRMDVNAEDKVFNALPVFHSFGLTAGCVMPVVGGIPVHLYPTPLHYRIIPELAYQTNATILFGTDTFLNGYARAAHPYDLSKLRMVVSGAEAVKDRTRTVYMEKFGVRILEGYGVTEAAPVVSVNTPMANRSGTVGRLSPLMEARLEPVAGVNDGGRLLVRGPNIMLGYYRADKPGVLEVPPGGWHDTGDIVAIDPQGYISIKGRLKRFAKIGGEMISLAAVEALSAELWPSLITVVVAQPDARKGEKLILLTTDAKCQRSAFTQFAKSRGATELMMPAEIVVVDKIPLLGSGKPDFVAATKLAAERLAQKAASIDAGAVVPVKDTAAA
jgi:acyl-[acyl-carrier-protein]-phospholipid O-acyltransferase / long-chain-fatty-acid--[acyl-carrier-protein] ligase